MKSEELHPILVNVPLKILDENIGDGRFLNEQSIAMNTNENYIGRVADCLYTVEITSLGNQDVRDILLKSQLSQENSIVLWSSYMAMETSVQTFTEFWEEFCFASVDLLIFKTNPSNFVGEYFKYHGREWFYANTPLTQGTVL